MFRIQAVGFRFRIQGVGLQVEGLRRRVYGAASQTRLP